MPLIKIFFHSQLQKKIITKSFKWFNCVLVIHVCKPTESLTIDEKETLNHS